MKKNYMEELVLVRMPLEEQIDIDLLETAIKTKIK